MTNADDRVDRLADKLQEFADRSVSDGGVKGKLAEPLADDAAFIRGLKPSLIKERAKRAAPTDQKPRWGKVSPRPSQPDERSSAQPKQRPKRPAGGGGGGPNPWLLVAVCLAAGVALAKWIDWRGHAHPKG